MAWVDVRAPRMASIVVLLWLLTLAGCTEKGDVARVGPRDETTPQFFVAPNGDDRGECDEGDPCSSFGRAFSVASPGASVGVSAGNYGAQTIVGGGEETRRAPVTFRPMGGAVRVGQVDIRAEGVAINDMELSAFVLGEGARGITLRNIDTSGQSIIEGARDVKVIGGDIGPTLNSDGIQIKRKRNGINPDNIVIDGVRFHDIRDAGAGHIDCIQVGGGTRITIRNARFERCGVRAVIFGSFSGGYFDGALVENNVFGPTQRSSIVFQAEEARNMTFRYNSIGANGVAIGTNPAGGAEGNKVVSNVGTLSSGTNGVPMCGSTAVTYGHNVWTNASCDDTDLMADPRFLDSKALNYRLGGDSPAIGRGDPSDMPERDIDGVLRPATRPTPGAYEP